MACFGLIRLTLGALGGGPGGVQPAHQSIAPGFQRPAVLGASGVHLRSSDVEVIVDVAADATSTTRVREGTRV